MAQNDAEIFLERCAADDEFRLEAYKAEGPGDFLAWVRNSGLSFDWHELENASRRMKLRARDEGEAAFVEELRLWYEFLSGGERSRAHEYQGASCSPSMCSSCGAASGCASGAASANGTKSAILPGAMP